MLARGGGLHPSDCVYTLKDTKPGDQGKAPMAPSSDKEAAASPALFTGVDDQVAACRAWGHDWPSRKLKAGHPLPPGYHPRLALDGFVEVSEECENGCGKKRHFTLLPGGVYDMHVRRSYTDPEHWPVFPRELGVTPRHFQAEVIRRNHEEIMAQARRNSPWPGNGAP
jgi:hypothetical protein